MSQFIGKTCPYCKTPFKEGDDVVICSVCEMPHHKECWVENQECTTFGCTGTIQGTSAKNSGMAFCPYCGTPHAIGDSFCGTCGKNLKGDPTPVRQAPVQPAPAPRPVYTPPQQTYAPPQQTYKPAAPLTGPYDAYIEKKTDYYNKKFNAMDAQNKKASWNWAAFLISPFWCIYRKMYVHAAIMYVAAAILTSYFGYWGSLIALAGYAVFGIFANHLYREHLKKVSGFAAHVSEPAKGKFLKMFTGADMSKAALICIITMVIVILLGK